jgi:hypothetical protein
MSRHSQPASFPAASQQLDYASLSNTRLPHSELGSLAVAFTGIWLACFGLSAAALTIHWWNVDDSAKILLGMLTLMAMVIFVPMGFLTAVLGLTEQNCRRTSAYVCASINGAVLTIVVFAVAWGLVG